MSNYLDRFRLSPQALWNLPLLWSNTEQMSEPFLQLQNFSWAELAVHWPRFSQRNAPSLAPPDGPCEYLAASLLLRVYLLCGLVEFFGGFFLVLAKERQLCRVSETLDAQQSILPTPPPLSPPPCKKRTKIFNIFCRIVSSSLYEYHV